MTSAVPKIAITSPQAAGYPPQKAPAIVVVAPNAGNGKTSATKRGEPRLAVNAVRPASRSPSPMPVADKAPLVIARSASPVPGARTCSPPSDGPAIRLHIPQAAQAPRGASPNKAVGEAHGSFNEDFRLNSDAFDPVADVPLRQRLFLSLCMDAHTAVEAVRGRGGLNDGIWRATERGGASFILKLVRNPQEASNFRRLRSEHGNICGDTSVAFPTNILRLLGPAGTRAYDLIVMRQARGQALGDVIADKHYSGRGSELPRILEEVGRCVARFHQSYGGKQHGDLQTSNVFYDAATHQVTLIDVGGMGVNRTESDSGHFTSSLDMMLKAYSPQLESMCRGAFARGYGSAGRGGGGCRQNLGGGHLVAPPAAAPAAVRIASPALARGRAAAGIMSPSPPAPVRFASPALTPVRGMLGVPSPAKVRALSC